MNTDGKPQWNQYILVDIEGDTDNYEMVEPDPYYSAANKTMLRVNIYNILTNAYGNKALYENGKGLYFKETGSKKAIYINDFYPERKVKEKKESKDDWSWVQPIIDFN